MKDKLIYLFIFLFLPSCLYAQEAQTLIEKSWDYLRGETSKVTLSMTIHRPEWERTFKMQAFTKGRSESIFFITSPAKDKGNGTLKKGKEMWMYNPKIKRVLKIPPSMMSQSWMGSDFSNNDLAKSDSIVEDYTHEILRIEENKGHKVYVIQSIPKPNAPIVWGMQILKIRDDSILIEEKFYDEDKKLVKEMLCSQIEKLGNKLYPKTWIMRKADTKDQYTKIFYEEAEFDIPVKDHLFSLSNLKRARQL